MTTSSLFEAVAAASASLDAAGGALAVLQESLQTVASRAQAEQARALDLLGTLPTLPDVDAATPFVRSLGIGEALAGLIAAREHLGNHGEVLGVLAGVAGSQSLQVEQTRTALGAMASPAAGQQANCGESHSCEQRDGESNRVDKQHGCPTALPAATSANRGDEHHSSHPTGDDAVAAPARPVEAVQAEPAPVPAPVADVPQEAAQARQPACQPTPEPAFTACAGPAPSQGTADTEEDGTDGWDPSQDGELVASASNLPSRAVPGPPLSPPRRGRKKTNPGDGPNR